VNPFWTSLRFFGLILVELGVLFMGISTLVGLAFEYISNETLRRWLNRRGWLGNLLGASLGAATPFCSCSTIPMTVGLLRAGVPFGATMSFLLASPLLNPVILAMFLALLGWKACFAYGSVTFVGSMICGAAMEWAGLARYVKDVRISGGLQERERLAKFSQKLRRACARAWGDFRAVLPYLLAGVAIGAAVYGYVPESLVLRLAGTQDAIAIPVAAVIGIPLYVRAETIIPIAVALTKKGMALGPMIALVIGGAGLSIPEMSMLAAIFEVRLVAAFVAVVFLTATLAGFLFSAI